jgi:hypothetical protein
MLDLDEIKKRIIEGETIEKIIKDIDWKEFEKLVVSILKNHDFKSFHSFRFKTESRFEIDILSIKEKIILAIDCKQWNKGRYKKSGLKNAAKSQRERVKQLKKFLKGNIITKEKLKLKKNMKFLPLIVTWYEEDLVKYDDILIVPIWKFNQFLLSLSEYI